MTRWLHSLVSKSVTLHKKRTAYTTVISDNGPVAHSELEDGDVNEAYYIDTDISDILVNTSRIVTQIEVEVSSTRTMGQVDTGREGQLDCYKRYQEMMSLNKGNQKPSDNQNVCGVKIFVYLDNLIDFALTKHDFGVAVDGGDRKSYGGDDLLDLMVGGGSAAGGIRHVIATNTIKPLATFLNAFI